MIYIVSLLMIMSSCTVPRHIKNAFIGCYDDTPTGIDTLLDLSGCFWTSSSVPFRNEGLATEYRFLIFYNDGIVVRYGATSPQFGYKVYAAIQHELNQINVDSQKYKYFWGGGNFYKWGLYKMENNTIEIQFIYRPSIQEGYHSSVVRYRVIDKHTIQELLFNDVKETYNFMPIEKLPSSECWLKSEKWFWCDEELYKQYKQTLKSR